MFKQRRGFKYQEIAPDWSVDGDYLCWKSPTTHKIRVADLRSVKFDDPSQSLNSNSSRNNTNLKLFYKDPSALKAEQRYALMDNFHFLSEKDFFKLAPLVVANYRWSDSEKMHLLASKLKLINGFKSGQEAQRLLWQISWKNSSARERIVEYFKYQKANQDSQIFDDDLHEFIQLSSPIIVYRGFNVPFKETIRNKNVTKSWFRQETGKSIFFTTSEKIAKWFASTQKLNVIQKYRMGDKLSTVDKNILGGRLCIAKYHASIDDIVLFQNKSGRNECEVILQPSKADLKNYKFLGFDDFLNTLNNPPHT